MHRIYKAEVTPDYILRTTFFNGEVRELVIENDLRRNQSYKHLLKYAELTKALTISKSKSEIEFVNGPKFTNDELYYDALLRETVYIDDVNIQLAAKLQAMREAARMTQKDMEAASGIHQAEISKIERGIGNPSLETIERLAFAAGCHVNINFVHRGIRRDVPQAKGIIPYLKAVKYQGEYVISDLADVPDDVFFELIEGCVYERNTPTVVHQAILAEFVFCIKSFIKSNKGKCTVLPAPTGLTFENDDKNFLIPDLMIVCDENKFSYEVVKDAPDFVLEIASPSNSRRDYGVKYKIYMEKGVREYWILNPMKKVLVVYDFRNGEIPEIHNFDEEVDIEIYDGKLKIDLREVDAIIRKYEHDAT